MTENQNANINRLIADVKAGAWTSRSKKTCYRALTTALDITPAQARQIIAERW